MTIKDFAKLCGCNPQTLRYYDREGLLKPETVDASSGYRYYNERQALDFVKIRELRTAGFSIGEIRELLDKDSEAVCEVLDKKIKALEDLLERARVVRMSYISNIKNMSKKIKEFTKQIEEAMLAYAPGEDFDISPEQYERITNSVLDVLKSLPEQVGDIDTEELAGEDGLRFEDMNDAKFAALKTSPEFETIFERQGWTKVSDILCELPELEDGQCYAFCIETPEKKGYAFANTLLSLVLEGNQEKKLDLQLYVGESKDGENHLLLRKKR